MEMEEILMSSWNYGHPDEVSVYPVEQQGRLEYLKLFKFPSSDPNEVYLKLSASDYQVLLKLLKQI